MFCYNCGCLLSEHDFCTSCGADVSLYKKIISVSNRFYNEGLEKANVRDLSGAIVCLRQSLKFCKTNVEARNLLGLVYFEMGEVVAALSEWVISKNMRPEKNIADDYIKMVQNNATRLDSINQTIKKYNQSLVYCTQDSKDLAVIQLKKVLSLNPKFIRAHLLLALLYIDREDFEHAGRELSKCLEVDRNNTMALRYQADVEKMLTSDETEKTITKKGKNKSVRYQSDNEVIIQPFDVKEVKSGGFSSLINIGIGILIGLAVMYFLVVPAAISNVNNEAQNQITELGNQMDEKTSKIQELEATVEDLNSQIDSLNDEISGFTGTDGTLSVMDSLLEAAQTYIETQDANQTADKLETIAGNVNLDETSESFKNLYNTLLATIGPDLATNYYNDGYAAYKNEDYQTAIDNLTKAVFYDSSNGEALYSLGNAYRKNGDNDKALETYQSVVTLFPDTELANKATKYIDSISEGTAEQ